MNTDTALAEWWRSAPDNPDTDPAELRFTPTFCVCACVVCVAWTLSWVVLAEKMHDTAQSGAVVAAEAPAPWTGCLETTPAAGSITGLPTLRLGHPRGVRGLQHVLQDYAKLGWAMVPVSSHRPVHSTNLTTSTREDLFASLRACVALDPAPDFCLLHPDDVVFHPRFSAELTCTLQEIEHQWLAESASWEILHLCAQAGLVSPGQPYVHFLADSDTGGQRVFDGFPPRVSNHWLGDGPLVLVVPHAKAPAVLARLEAASERFYPSSGGLLLYVGRNQSVDFVARSPLLCQPAKFRSAFSQTVLAATGGSPGLLAAVSRALVVAVVVAVAVACLWLLGWAVWGVAVRARQSYATVE